MQNRFWYLLSKKLGGQLTDAELAELDELEIAQPEWNTAAHHVTNIWHHEKAEETDEAAFDRHLARMTALGYETPSFEEKNASSDIVELQPQKKTWKRFGWLSIAASVAGIIFWVLVAGKDEKTLQAANDTASGGNLIATNSGKREKILLPDGTQVWLNAESKLQFGKGFGTTDRHVILSGEAFFDVVKNTALPFTIQTDKIRIKVTGTAFNVKAYPKEPVSEASIIRGRVEVTVNARPDEKYVLKHDEKLVIRDEKPAGTQKQTIHAGEAREETKPLIQLGYVNYIENDSTILETSWVYNRLVFDNESFSEMIPKLERWYGVHIDVADVKVAATRFTYQIKNETIDKALRNMQYVAHFHYSISGSNITITK